MAARSAAEHRSNSSFATLLSGSGFGVVPPGSRLRGQVPGGMGEVPGQMQSPLLKPPVKLGGITHEHAGEDWAAVQLDRTTPVGGDNGTIEGREIGDRVIQAEAGGAGEEGACPEIPTKGHRGSGSAYDGHFPRLARARDIRPAHPG